MKWLESILFLSLILFLTKCDDFEDPPPPEPSSSEPTDQSESNDEDNSVKIFLDVNNVTATYDPKACTIDPPPTLDELNQFYEWADMYNKTYSTANLRICATIKVVYHIRQVAVHNKLADNGLVSYRRDLTHMSDSSHDEKKEKLLMKELPPMPHLRQAPPVLLSLPPAKASVDWNAAGLVGPVGSQWQCGSCYAWAGAVALEGQLRKCGFSNEAVSVQMMVNCPTVGCWGCQSGWPFYTYKWGQTVGVFPAAKYTYQDKLTKCSYTATDIMAYIDKPYKYDFTAVGGNASFIQQVVSSYGPVAGFLCVENSLLQYSSGVYSNPTCCKTIKHAVGIVGYGTDPVGGDYWLIKNSWGPSWGLNGFAKIARGSNTCMIESQVQFTTVRSLDGKPCPFP